MVKGFPPSDKQTGSQNVIEVVSLSNRQIKFGKPIQPAANTLKKHVRIFTGNTKMVKTITVTYLHY